MRIVNTGSGFETIGNTNLTSYTASGLECCSDYTFSVTGLTIDYGAPSLAQAFRTMPNFNGIVLKLS